MPRDAIEMHNEGRAERGLVLFKRAAQCRPQFETQLRPDQIDHIAA
jgi:hypothetical protein